MKRAWAFIAAWLFGMQGSVAQPVARLEAKALAWNTNQADFRSGALGRVRLALEDVQRACGWNMRWNLEVLTGAAARSPQVRALWRAPSGVDAVKAEWTQARPRHLERVRLHRLDLACASESAELHAGRLRIAWGVGEIWTLLDRFHAAPVTALEPDEVAGADGIDARLRTAWGELRGSFAPGRAARRSHDRTAFGWQAPVLDWDLTLVAMRLGNERLVGLATAGNLGDAAWHAEATLSQWRTQKGARALVGLDGRSKSRPIDWGVELVWDDTVARMPPQPALLLGLARWQAGAQLRWEMHPLWTLTGWLLAASSNDRAVQLALQHSAAEDWQLEGFVRWTQASRRAIYGRGHLIAVSVSYFH